MKRDAKRYLMGSFVSVDAIKIAQITSLNEQEVGVVYADGSKDIVPWHYIRPISLDPQYMHNIGFRQIRRTQLQHHYEVMMDIKINGRLYVARGVCLKDRSLWSFNNVSAQYLHQVQSLIWIIEPSYEFFWT